MPSAIRLKALRAAGISVADASWALGDPARTMRDSGEENVVELLCCWPTERPLSPDWSLPGLAVESGQLGGGVELVVRWRHDQMVPSIDGTPHPAILALLTQAEARDIDVDLSTMRQLGLIEDGESVGFEVALPASRCPHGFSEARLGLAGLVGVSPGRGPVAARSGGCCR